jgi:DNA-binding transcriptional ArsR family regulator
MSDDNAALMTCYRLEALGNMTRLAIFRLLVRAGDEGLAVGDIQRALAVPPSTLSHHLQRLSHVGLLSQERRGRVLICRADFAAINGVVAYLTEECCMGVGEAAKGPRGATTRKRAKASAAGAITKPARAAKRPGTARPARATATRR